ncbi:polyketide synthase, putative [Beauveria bassiana ARSEF 2860]|uniref:Polyketide synthase, putative n=1 Tax=Beauveria bassiana (strain ARSEF 2860) TaxID=655819 RepID=J5JUG2_BEAB2|nr:polyketide synthase, putative [Beauveria bassiana ARSEF 2860]EJP66156.1 polyketide synthase, putative [Beauveria bassiana ARSEF 2860]
MALLLGPFASRARVVWHGVTSMPAGMGFNDAASLPMVFFKPPGGVGQAAVMLAKDYLGAEVYATAGSQEKRDLLTREYGIPPERIFNSRDAYFAPALLQATGGRGVDAVLNSLGGSLLQASFDVLAPFGHFVEIGKRDLEQNSLLEMGTFTRAVSFTSLDIMAWLRQRGCDTHRVLTELGRLAEQKIIRPVQSINVYPMSQADKAFRLLQTGRHIGKLVLSTEPDALVKVLPRPVAAKFNSDATYLLIGGVGVLGRSLASWMVDNGAKNLILPSRSAGKQDSSSFVAQLRAVGCCVAAIRPKVDATWNLHSRFSQRGSLDFFIMLSSLSCILGWASQASYAAGGTYQDALARWRCASGLPALFLDMGIIKDVGYVAESRNVSDRLRKVGQSVRLDEDAVLRTVGTAVIHPFGRPQILLGLNSGPGAHGDPNSDSQMGRDARFMPLRNRQRLVSRSKAHTSGDDADSEPLSIKLQSAESTDEAAGFVGGAIAAKLADIFMIPVDDIDLEKPPSVYGIDSLVAVELRNMLVLQAATDISIFSILQSVSLAALAVDVVAKSAHIKIAPATVVA